MNAQQFASNLRKRRKAGEQWSADEIAWMERYEAVKGKPGRKRSAPPPLTDTVDDTGAPDESPSSAGAPVDPPPIDVRSPSDEGADPESAAPSSAKPTQGDRDESEGEHSSTVDDQQEKAHIAKCQALAHAAGEWMKGEHRKFAANGMPSIPPDGCDALKAVFFIAFHEYLPRKTSPRAAAIGTVACLGGTFVGSRILKRKEMQNAQRVNRDPNRGPNGERFAQGSQVSEKQQQKPAEDFTI